MTKSVLDELMRLYGNPNRIDVEPQESWLMKYYLSLDEEEVSPLVKVNSVSNNEADFTSKGEDGVGPVQVAAQRATKAPPSKTLPTAPSAALPSQQPGAPGTQGSGSQGEERSAKFQDIRRRGYSAGGRRTISYLSVMPKNLTRNLTSNLGIQDTVRLSS
jgi:hypothetical protein